MFTVKAITTTTPATYRQVDYWCRQGIVEPVRGADGSGTGKERIFFGPDLERARAVARLVFVGVGPQLASMLSRFPAVRVAGGYRLALTRAS